MMTMRVGVVVGTRNDLRALTAFQALERGIVVLLGPVAFCFIDEKAQGHNKTQDAGCLPVLSSMVSANIVNLLSTKLIKKDSCDAQYDDSLSTTSKFVKT